VLCFKDS